MLLYLCLLWAAMPGEVVENGLLPTGKPQTLIFERDLRVGPDGDDERFIWTGAAVMPAVAADGTIYVMDQMGLRIVQLNPDGGFVRSFGHEGEGPGEFRQLTNLSVLEDGRVVAAEFRQGASYYSFFDRDGTFLNRTDSRAAGILTVSCVFAPKGPLLRATYFSTTPDGTTFDIGYGVFTQDFKRLVDMGHESIPRPDRSRLADPRFWSEYLGAWYAIQPRQGLMAFDEEGRVFTARGDRYEITRTAADLGDKLVFRRAFKPRLMSTEQMDAMLEPMRRQVLANLPGSFHSYITDSVLAKAVELADLPERQSPVVGLVPTGDGGVLVVNDFDPLTEAVKGDLFDAGGRYLGTCDLPHPEINMFGGYTNMTVKLWFRGGKAYSIEDQDGDMYLNRYTTRLAPAP